ncbi:efflux RND transporter periplasmic adaptor subunit [bacterium]|nr:efflux RND transporter periplasmic adaptor subunit [bacterium]
MKNKKNILGFVIIILIAAIVWRVYKDIISGNKGIAQNRGPVPVSVEVSPVQNAQIRDIQIFTGTLIPKAQFVAAPKIGGQVKRLMVNIGDVIRRNQLIALLDDDEYVQQAEQARADLMVANANLEAEESALAIAQREFKRIQALYEKKIASESELDAVQSQFESKNAKQKVAVAQVAEKEAALKAAQVRLSYTKILASWDDGYESRIVGERFVDEGSMLTAHSPIVSILDINSLYAVVYVIEKDYPKVLVGQEARIVTDAYPDKTFAGRIVRKAPVLKMESLQARVEIDIPNPDWLLKPGMFARVHIEFGRHEGATVIPTAAIVKRENQQGVFLVDEGHLKVSFIPLTLGIINSDFAEILDPSISGLVVTLGNHLLEDDSAIILPKNI